VEQSASPLSYREVLRRWREDADFRVWFIALLADVPFSAFRWETPPLIATTADRPFEFVLLDSPHLETDPDPESFNSYFKGRAAGRGVVAFPNLGRDAVLVVPCPVGPLEAYPHLAAFLRGAPDQQRHALWQVLGEAVERRLGAAPVWVSTAGAGVAWLHVRLDDRPKYYGYAPYRTAV
jgi:hypothetical protein